MNKEKHLATHYGTWRLTLRLGGASLLALMAAIVTGCSGINAGASVSPLDFLLPGLLQNCPASPVIPAETNSAPLLAQASSVPPKYAGRRPKRGACHQTEYGAPGQVTQNSSSTMKSAFRRGVAIPSLALGIAGLLLSGGLVSGANVELDSPATPAGYVALLLINEAAFPGERGYVSEEDSKAAMLSVLWVCIAVCPPCPRATPSRRWPRSRHAT